MINPILQVRMHSQLVSSRGKVQTRAGSLQSPLFTRSVVLPALSHILIFVVILYCSPMICAP